MRNLEFKARVSDLQEARRLALAAGGEMWGDLRQTDTYFATPKGRLKLRETAGFPAELVFYERDEDDPNRPSEYEVARSPDAEALRSVLTNALGVLTVVRKRRTLVHVDTARVHLDNVERLGSFVEIEVPVTDAQDEAAAKERIDSLIAALGLSWPGCIRESYLDLMLAELHPSLIEGED